MRTLPLVFLAALAPTTGAAIQDLSTSSAEEAEAAAEAYESVIDAWQLAQSEHRKAYGKAKTDEERMRIWSEERPDPNEFAPRFLEVAKLYPGGDVALDCYGWVVGNAKDSKMIEISVGVVIRDHLKQSELGGFVESIARSNNLHAEQAMQTILTISPHREVKGKACYHLGMKKLSTARLARRVAEAEENGAEFASGYYTEVAITRAKGLDPKVIQAVGERLLERVISEFGDVQGRRRTLGQSATAQLFEIRRLQLGMIAPEIEGEGVDEEPMKLSDFRGKVVLLDFWGDW